MKYIKLLALGDGAVGKSCLFISYATGSFPSEYVPTVFDNYTSEVVVDDQPITLSLWDTAGQEDYDRLRPLSYPGTDVFLVCFSVENRASLENVLEKWKPELDFFMKSTVPIFLVACKTDLRYTSSDLSRIVTKAEGEAVAKKCGYHYCETSALTQDGVKDCFENSIRVVLYHTKPKKRKKKSAPDPPVMPPAGKAPWIEVETSVFADQLLSLLQQARHSDVVFVMEETQRLEAHKIILAGASKFFAKIFDISSKHKTNQLDDIKSRHTFTREDLNSGKVLGISAVYDLEYDQRNRTTIELSSDIKAATFVHVLEFLYAGVPHLSEDVTDNDLGELVRVSKLFHLPQLETICTNLQTEQEFLNPSIGTYLNDETGQRIKELFFNQSTCADVRFKVGDSQIYAHKAILSARCEVMSAMFSGRFAESSQSMSEISIINRSPEGFMAFLEYLYTDHSPIEQSDSVEIISLGDEYGQPRLVNLCELYITKEVDRSCSKNIEKAEIDVIGLLNFSDVHNATQLSKWCLHFISTNYEPFSQRPEWPYLTGENLDYVERERWPPVHYLNEVKEYEKMMAKRGEGCSVM